MNLIDRDELRETMRRKHRASASEQDIMSMRTYYGETIRRKVEWKLGKGGATYSCPDCGYVAMPREAREWNFCPNCRAHAEVT